MHYDLFVAFVVLSPQISWRMQINKLFAICYLENVGKASIAILKPIHWIWVLVLGFWCSFMTLKTLDH